MKFSRHIVKNALARIPFYKFNQINHFFTDIRSINDFIDYENYLGGLEITFKGD